MVSRTTDYEKRASAFLLERSPAVAKSNARLVKSRKVRRILNGTLKMRGGLRFRNLFRRKKQPTFPTYNFNLPYTMPQKNTTKRSLYSRFKDRFFTRKQKNKPHRNSFAGENPIEPPSRTSRFSSMFSNVTRRSSASDPRGSVGSRGSFNTQMPIENNGFPAMPSNEETARINAEHEAVTKIQRDLESKLQRAYRVAVASGNRNKQREINAKLKRTRVNARNIYRKQTLGVQNF